MKRALVHMVYRVFPFVERYHSLRQFIKFCIVGSSNGLVDFSVYLAATRFFHVHYIVANFISFIFAVSWSFYWNSRWTFQSRWEVDLQKQYVKFFIINCIGVLLQTTALYIFVEHAGFDDISVKAVAIVGIAFWNFTLSRFWVFKKR